MAKYFIPVKILLIQAQELLIDCCDGNNNTQFGLIRFSGADTEYPDTR